MQKKNQNPEWRPNWLLTDGLAQLESRVLRARVEFALY